MHGAYKRHLLILTGYLGLTLLMSLPLVMSLNTHIAGTGGDPWQTMWRFESKAELLARPSFSPFWRGEGGSLGQEFFGGGEPRLVNLSVWPWMWLHVIFGQPLTYNIIWLAAFVLSGYGTFLLARRVLSAALHPHRASSQELRARGGGPPGSATRRRMIEVSAFIAGIYYMFLPYHVAQSYGHFGAMQTQWLPFIILTLLAWVRQPNIFKTLILAALLIVQGWSEHHYMLWLMLFVGLWIIFYWKRVRSFWLKKQGNKYVIVLAALLLFFVVLPYLPTIKLSAQPDAGLELGQEQTVRFSADLFSYLVPASFHTIWGGTVDTLFTTSFTGNVTEATHYLGLVPLLLVLFLHKRIPVRQRRFWLTVAIFFLLISLGPRLHMLGRVMNLPLPYAIVDNWPVFSAVRAVARASVMVGLAGAVLLGGVLAAQLRSGKGAIVIALLLLLEFLFMPWSLQSAQLPEVYEVIRELPGRALVEIPAATNYTAASRALYASGQHGKKVLGNIALERALGPDNFQAVHSLPALRQLLYLRTTTLLASRPEFFGQDMAETLPDVMKYLDTKGILLHTDSVSPVQLSAVKKLLEEEMGLVAKRYDDALLYVVTGGGDGVFLARDERWQNVGYDVRRDSVFGEVPSEANVVLYNVGAETAVGQLSFMIPPESSGQLKIKRGGEKIVLDKLAGGRVGLTLAVPTGTTILTFVNEGEGSVIIQNPSLKVP